MCRLSLSLAPSWESFLVTVHAHCTASPVQGTTVAGVTFRSCDFLNLILLWAKSVSIALSFCRYAKFSAVIKCKKLLFLQRFGIFFPEFPSFYAQIKTRLMETQLVPPWRGDIGVGAYHNAESSLSVVTCQCRLSDGKLCGTTTQRGWGRITVMRRRRRQYTARSSRWASWLSGAERGAEQSKVAEDSGVQRGWRGRGKRNVGFFSPKLPGTFSVNSCRAKV